MLGLGFALLLASASATFPGAQPQLTTDGPNVYLAFGTDGAIHVTRSEDGGLTFGEPSRIEAGGHMALGRHRGPRITATSSSVLVTAVVGETGGGADGDVVLYRSRDGGRTWAAPIVINDVPGSAREGLHGMASNASGFVAVAWLDLRATGTRIYAAVSRDHGETWSADRLVYASPSGSVCECCHPSVAIDADGRVAVMFRNNLEGNRDLHVARSAEDGSFGEAVRLGTTSWRLDACPMDGGGAAVAAGGLVAVWRRENAVLLSTPTTPERRLGVGRDPSIATAGSHVDVAWTTASGIVLSRDGGPAEAVAPGTFATLLALPASTVIAWEHDGVVSVRVIAR